MATGIIAEYNPFHNGHKYMLQQVKERTANAPVVVCISGSITQRGEMAILDKWQRAQAAVANGADLVIELPTIYACRSGQDFGYGGVQLLASTGLVDKLAFGTEYPDLDKLMQAASLQPEDYPLELQALLKSGHSYGSALSKLISTKLCMPEAMLREPNTILALEYLRALKKIRQKQGINITPLAICRQGVGHNHHELENATVFASGTAIRQAAISWYNGHHSDTSLEQASQGQQNSSHCNNTTIKQNMESSSPLLELGRFVPPATLESLSTAMTFPDMERLFPLLRWKLLTASPAELCTIYGVGEGLEHKLLQCHSCSNYEELVSYLATRRYPATRIQRLLMYLLLGVSKDQIAAADASGPLYIRILAFNDMGRQLLRDIKHCSSLPIIAKTSDYLNRRQLENKEYLTPLQQMLYLDILAANLRCMSLPTGILYQDLLQSPICRL